MTHTTITTRAIAGRAPIQRPDSDAGSRSGFGLRPVYDRTSTPPPIS